MTYHNIKVRFPEIDLDSYLINSSAVKKIHNAQIITTENEIELRVFYDEQSELSRKLSMWALHIDWGKFGSMLRITCKKEKGLQKIDLSNSKLLGITNSTANYLGKKKYVSVKLNAIKFYWSPAKEELNTASFYFNRTGFKVVENFYSFL